MTKTQTTKERKVLYASEISDADLRDLTMTKVDPKHRHLNKELKSETTSASIKYIPSPLQIGKYTLSGPFMMPTNDGPKEQWWLEHESGEGMSVSLDLLEKQIAYIWEFF